MELYLKVPSGMLILYHKVNTASVHVHIVP